MVENWYSENSNTETLLRQLFNQTYDVDMKPSDDLTMVTITPNTFILLSMDQTQETIQYSEEFLLVRTWTQKNC